MILGQTGGFKFLGQKLFFLFSVFCFLFSVFCLFPYSTRPLYRFTNAVT